MDDIMLKVESKQDLEENIYLVESYLQEPEGSLDRKEMIRLIKDGRNFIRYRIGDEYHFVPSKYIGYRNNTIRKHLGNLSKRKGGFTDVAIEKLLGCFYENEYDIDEKYYLLLCQSLKINITKIKRDYWHFDDINDNVMKGILNDDLTSSFQEGAISEVVHKKIERSYRLVRTVKELNKDHLICCVCKFDFHEHYGDLGKDFIEVHHTKPVSEMKKGDLTKIEDVVIVCSNCHRMLHRRRPWLTIGELDKILKKT